METLKSTFIQIFKRKESLLYIVILIVGQSLLGWVSGKMGLATLSINYIPIAPATIVIFIVLSILFFSLLNFEKSRLAKLIALILILLVTLFCLSIILNFLFNFTWDSENIFISNPVKFGNIPTGRMSPITSVLFIIICISLLSISKNNSGLIRYIGGSFSLLAGIISSVLLIGYLYKAPLLYGGQIIPVSLPSAICFLLFSISLLRVFELQFWTFNLIENNKVIDLLLKSFLPIVIFIVVLQGFLVTNFTVVHNNLSLSVAIILLIVIVITAVLVIRASSVIGVELLKKEKALRESEEKFRLIMENSADAIFITDQQGKYIYTNKAVTDMLGYTSDEILSKTIIDISPTDKIDEYFKFFRQVLNVGKGFTEVELLKKDGNYISTDLNVVLLPNSLVYGSCRDITVRKKTEKILQESESSLQEAQKLANMGSWVLNFIDNTAEWSENCFIMYGYKPFEFKPTFEHFKNRVHPDDWHIIEKNMESVLRNKKTNISEMRIILPDNTIKWFQNNVAPVFQNDKIVKLKGINIDITERKMAEIALKESETKLGQLNADKDRFISILGHDLRSPFNNLLGLSAVLIKDIHELEIDEIEDIANDINKSAQLTYNLLEDILVWASAQSGKIPFNPQLLNFENICSEVIEIINPNALVKNITIQYSAPDHLNVFADPDMLKTIMRNLVSNAIKFTNIGGAINISAEQKQSNITIMVTDNGVGIMPKNLAKLFDISEVITTKGTAKESGTGLGLLLCKEFIEKHGGKIWVESEPGQGSVFKFILPISNKHENAIIN